MSRSRLADAGIRHEHPDLDETGVWRLVAERIALADALERQP
jgi:hypothetical protein